ncbi:hypothetical protein CEP52_006640 [Fusarium oligoseptatum]|uniref:Cytidyltransferase-like domain-containing protein n=1 Tax=Fusarium oligoseptatum TaxID=2604345 RepID=A0A428TRR7_9HYPO|nr:hypothetical protein CEP52_006640 [Fusarium oligoseptatum]
MSKGSDTTGAVGMRLMSFPRSPKVFPMSIYSVLSAHLEMFDSTPSQNRILLPVVTNEVFSVLYLTKQGLAPAHHRIEMCKLAAEGEYDWLTVDPWEAKSPTTIPTAQVLDHVDYEINEVMGGIECEDRTKRPAKIVLLAGLDLVQTMSTPGIWEKSDLDHILGRYGLFALERRGTETEPALASLKQWRHNIHILRKHVTEDISSTKTRLLLKQDPESR